MVGGLREVEGVGKRDGGILSTLTYSEGTGFKFHFSVVLSPVFKYLCSKSFVQIPLCFGRVLTFLFRNLINFFSKSGILDRKLKIEFFSPGLHSSFSKNSCIQSCKRDQSRY